MSVQLPPEAMGGAIGVLVYTVITLFCSLLLFLLAWIHERFSYVAMLSVFMGLSSAVCIARIVISILFFKDVAIAEWMHAATDPTNPALVVFGSTEGISLILLSIQFYAWQVQALTVSCWAFELCLSVLPVKAPRTSIPWRFIMKMAAAVLPALDVVVLQLKPLQASVVGYLIVANGLIAFGLVSSALLLLVMLCRYIRVRRQAASWKPASKWSSKESPYAIRNARHTYDRWLVVRFTIGFIAMGAFEVVMILFEFLNFGEAARDAVGHSPDLSPSAAAARFPQLIPEVSAGLLAFVVFGTTKVYRTYLWGKLVQRKPAQPRKIVHLSEATSREPLATKAPRLEGGGISGTQTHGISFVDDVLRSLHETEISQKSTPSSNLDSHVDTEDRPTWYSDEESAIGSANGRSHHSNKTMEGFGR